MRIRHSKLEIAAMAVATIGMLLPIYASIATIPVASRAAAEIEAGASSQDTQALTETIKKYETVRKVGHWVFYAGTGSYVLAYLLRRWSTRGGPTAENASSGNGRDPEVGPGQKAWLLLTVAGLLLLVSPLFLWPMIEEHYRAADQAATPTDEQPEFEALTSTSSNSVLLNGLVTIAGIGRGPMLAMCGVWMYQRSRSVAQKPGV